MLKDLLLVLQLTVKYILQLNVLKAMNSVPQKEENVSHKLTGIFTLLTHLIKNL